MKTYLRWCLLLYGCVAVSLAGASVDLRNEFASQSTLDVANWIISTRDYGNKPFIIVDKLNAKVFVFDHFGVFVAATPALLGLAKGDTLSAGMGARKLSTILPRERMTPAGRFDSALDYNLNGDLVLWIDYDSGVALHAVVTTNPSERRLQRLESPTIADNRITYGCINVPIHFYESVVLPQFVGVTGVVYLLPEMKANSLLQVFGPGIAKYLH